MRILSRERFAALRDGLHATCFAPDARDTRWIGAEVELLAFDQATGRPAALLGEPRGLVARLRSHGARRGWRERTASGGVPAFVVLGDDGGGGGEGARGSAMISFEPGGQLEVSSAPHASPSALIASLRAVLVPLCAELSDQGVRLEAIGIDPAHDACDVPLQVRSPRYRRMTEYFDSLGPAGARMMRQTASIQLCVDRGTAPMARWRLLNDLTPFLVATFANSPLYLRADTGHQSYRAHCWRTLDPSRTGTAVDGGDPAAAYTRFALGAHEMLRPDSHERHLSFEDCLLCGVAGDHQWTGHLGTLFPEVRPRGHFEVRSCDAVALDWIAAPIVLLSALVFDAVAAAEAAELVREGRALLEPAGVHGLGDPRIGRTARDLVHLALEAAGRLGPAYCSPADVEVAREFCALYTDRGRAPAADHLDAGGARTPSGVVERRWGPASLPRQDEA